MSAARRLFKWGGPETFEERREEQRAKLAACPEAQQYTDEEVQEFIAVMRALDRKGGLPDLIQRLRQVRIPYPPELNYDHYRLGWFLLHRWPEIRTKLVQELLYVQVGKIRRSEQKEGIPALLRLADDDTPPVAVWLLRRCGLEHRIPEMKAAFSEPFSAWYQDMLTEGRLAMHYYLKNPEPPRRAPSWERQKILRRLRLREVQVSSLRRNLRAIRKEQKALVVRLRRSGRVNRPELDALASELADLRRQRAEAERRHAESMAVVELQHQQAIAEMKAAISRIRQDCTETLALRRSWVPVRRGKEHG